MRYGEPIDMKTRQNDILNYKNRLLILEIIF